MKSGRTFYVVIHTWLPNTIRHRQIYSFGTNSYSESNTPIALTHFPLILLRYKHGRPKSIPRWLSRIRRCLTSSTPAFFDRWPRKTRGRQNITSSSTAGQADTGKSITSTDRQNFRLGAVSWALTTADNGNRLRNANANRPPESRFLPQFLFYCLCLSETYVIVVLTRRQNTGV